MLEIGRGREATVYAKVVRNLKTGALEFSAVRVLRQKHVERPGAAHTLRLCALPANAHVVKILKADPCTGLLVLQYVGGGTLADELVCGEMCRQRAEVVISHVLRGLAHLHAHGLAHGDISPGNVLLGFRSHKCKLSDYYAEQPRVGAPAYTAPEAARGDAVHASDVWSVGCLMLAVTGRAPWHDADVVLEDGSCVDLSSPAALLYHLACRDIAGRGPPEFATCVDASGRLFFDVLPRVFQPCERRASADALLAQNNWC